MIQSVPSMTESGMLEKTYNEVVRLIKATTADEVSQVLALLPDAVRLGVAEEVSKFGDAHRYDAHAKRIYYFEQNRAGITVWSWSHVYRPHEAGEIIFRVVSSATPLNEQLANEVYSHATGRTATDRGATDVVG